MDEPRLLGKIFELGLTYDQIRDRDLELTRLFRVTGTPTVIILDANGEVAYKSHEAPQSWKAYL